MEESPLHIHCKIEEALEPLSHQNVISANAILSNTQYKILTESLYNA